MKLLGHIIANSIRCCVACCYHCSMLSLCICLSVYLLVMSVRCAKMNELVEISFGGWTRLLTRNHVCTCIRWEFRCPEGALLGVILGHAETCLLLIFSASFLRRQEWCGLRWLPVHCVWQLVNLIIHFLLLLCVYIYVTSCQVYICISYYNEC